MAIVHAGRRRALVPLCPRSQACVIIKIKMKEGDENEVNELSKQVLELSRQYVEDKHRHEKEFEAVCSDHLNIWDNFVMDEDKCLSLNMINYFEGIASVRAMWDFVERRAAVQKFVGTLCRGKVQYPRCRGARALRAVNPP